MALLGGRARRRLKILGFCAFSKEKPFIFWSILKVPGWPASKSLGYAPKSLGCTFFKFDKPKDFRKSLGIYLKKRCYGHRQKQTDGRTNCDVLHSRPA